MGCLDAKVKIISTPPIVGVGSYAPMSLRVATAGVVKATADIVGGIIAAITNGPHMQARCSLVCDINTDPYLLVSPAETLWITDDTDAIYKVVSNIEWTIEID